MEFALILTTIAGLSTALGGIIVAFLKKPIPGLMSASMGFAGGVMLTVALADMLPESVHQYNEVFSKQGSAWRAATLFAMGMIVAVLLQKLLPSQEEVLAKTGMQNKQRAIAVRSAAVTMAVVTVHNLPEGIITLFTSFAMPQIGLTLALAIAMHNIPEGIAISVPVYYATGSKFKAFMASLLSGIAEPSGAILAFFLLRNVISELFLTGLLAIIAGIMACVSLTELLPDGFAVDAECKNFCAAGAIIGCLIMCIGIFLI